jgi:hypothetical protein
VNAAVGFTAVWQGTAGHLAAARAAQRRALAHFDELGQLPVRQGKTELDLWGRDDLSDCLHYLPDGSLLVLIGSPLGDFSWATIQTRLTKLSNPGDFELPWDGRVVLLKISPDGNQWLMWNDWLGSIPVFHTQRGQGRIASTLEPAVVAAAGFTPDDIFLPGVVSLLIHGNLLSDWTLFKDMKVVPPDCVAEWDGRRFRWARCLTVKPSDERWEEGWDELVDEMHHLSRQAIAEVLQSRPSWILPLSGGLDSRLIAAVGAELGADMYAYTWGSKASRDVLYARRVARALGLPWTWIDLGTDYLVEYVRLWADLFGSAMHFHGMYQMPFLDTLRSGPSGPIVSGFIGECMAGYDVRFQALLHSPSQRIYQSHPEGYIHWAVKDIQPLLRFQAHDALEQVAAEIKRQSNAVPGPWFQRLRFLTLWGRQRHFTYFSAKLCEYWRGVATPYLNRTYARFCLSLPRAVLEERRLQHDMFRRYYSGLATIPIGYGGSPLINTGRYLLKRRIARVVPRSLMHGPWREFSASPPFLDGECARKSGQASFWPIDEAWDRLGGWLDLNQIEPVYKAAINGDMRAVRKLQSIQAFAYRLLDS